MDTIISITKTGLTPFLTIKSDYLVTKQDIQTTKNNKSINVMEGLLHVDKIYNIHDYIENDSFILFSYAQGYGLRTIRYNKKDNTIKKIAGILDDLVFKINLDKQEVGVIPNFVYSDKKGIYGYVSPDDMEKFIGLLNKKKLNLGIEQKVREMEIKEDSNPIIFYYQYK